MTEPPDFKDGKPDGQNQSFPSKQWEKEEAEIERILREQNPECLTVEELPKEKLAKMILPLLNRRMELKDTRRPATEQEILDEYTILWRKASFIQGKIINYNVLARMIESGEISADSVIISTDINFIEKIIANDGKIPASKAGEDYEIVPVSEIAKKH
jgi:hypothetical protein